MEKELINGLAKHLKRKSTVIYGLDVKKEKDNFMAVIETDEFLIAYTDTLIYRVEDFLKSLMTAIDDEYFNEYIGELIEALKEL